MKEDWKKITDVKYKITKKDHGRTIKVGKYDFIKIWIKGEWEFWKHGFADSGAPGDSSGPHA
jgi:hypothetical protein